MFMVWNLLLTLVVIHDTIMITLSFVFGFEIKGNFMIVDIIVYVFLAFDMAVRAKTAILSPKKYCFDPDKVLNHYLNTWFLLDLFATFPLCYILLISPKIDPYYLAMARLPRLLKIFRLHELTSIFKWNSDRRVEIGSLVQLFLLYGLVGLFYGCGYSLIGRRYYNTNARFDGKTLYNYMETRPW